MLDGKSIGARVKTLRERKRFSMRGLAQKAGVSHSSIYLLEHGRIPSPGFTFLQDLSRGLGVSVDELMVPTSRNEATADAYDIQVNLIKISTLNPRALKTVASIVEAIRQQEEAAAADMRSTQPQTSPTPSPEREVAAQVEDEPSAP